MSLSELLSSAKKKKICVIGDVMIDNYRMLKASRLSPEAPVIIFEEESSDSTPGGAGNVAMNLQALGVEEVCLCSVVGGDWKRMSCDVDFRSVNPVMIVDHTRRTTIKERLVTKRQQLARVDAQTRTMIGEWATGEIIAAGLGLVQACDVVVFSDYDHGVISPEVATTLVRAAVAAGKPIVVDSKAKDFRKFKNATIALPNHIEAQEMTNLHGLPPEHVAGWLVSELNLDAVGLTLGPDGILLAMPGFNKTFPTTNSAEVVDVSGAGDTVTAAVAMALSIGMGYEEAMKLANLAAGVVVQKWGVATTTIDEICCMAEHNGVVIAER